MDPDLLYAESVKYARTLHLVHCPSGRWAVFDNRYHFIGFATCMEDLPEPIEIHRPRPVPRNNPDDFHLEIIL